MIKESRYILRRIFVGVGIVLALSFIRSGKVLAYEDINTNFVESSMTVNDFNSNTNDYQLLLTPYNGVAPYKIYYGKSNNSIVLATTQHSYEWSLNNLFTINNIAIYSSGTSNNALIFLSEGDIVSLNSDSYNSYSKTVAIGTSCSRAFCNPSSSSARYSTSENYIPALLYTYYYNNNDSKRSSWASQDFYVRNSILVNASELQVPPSVPDFVSWHWTKITNNNIITGISLRPEFSIWNTTDYDYQYKIGKDSTTWLSLTENQQLFTFHNNGVMLYIRIKKRSDNSIILGSNFTTANIGTYYDSPEYNINFSGEYRTENYLNNNVSKLQSVIKEYSIYVDYFPKNSITKYQYQYITSGTCNDVETWQQVSSLDNGSFTYVASQNGTLCARILDSSDTVQYEDSYEVSTIGELAFDTGSSQVKGFFDKISSKINYGGPVGSLFRIPVETLSTLYSTMNNSNSCTPYSLPPIFGTTIQLGCYNFKNIVGNSVYNIIDAIFTFILCFGIFKMALKLYHNLISMKDIS